MGGESLRVIASTAPLTIIAGLSNGPEADSVKENGNKIYWMNESEGRMKGWREREREKGREEERGEREEGERKGEGRMKRGGGGGERKSGREGGRREEGRKRGGRKRGREGGRERSKQIFPSAV